MIPFVEVPDTTGLSRDTLTDGREDIEVADALDIVGLGFLRTAVT